MSTSTIFKGLICPLLTPFTPRGRINESVMRELVDFLIPRGVDAFLTAGTTGEGMLLDIHERKRLAEVVVDHTAKRAVVIVHTGCITTADTINLTCHAQQIGADGVSIITPFFYTLDEQALYDHYTSVAWAVPDFPISLYSFPENAKHAISSQLLIRLRKNAPNIQAIKMSENDLIRFQEYVNTGGENFSALCGVDALALPALCIGSRGQISGNSNVFPETFRRLIDAYEAGDLIGAGLEQRRVNQIRDVLKDNLAYFKTALSLRGINVGGVRPPLRDLAPCEKKGLQKVLNQLGLI